LLQCSIFDEKTRLARSSTTPHCLHAVGIFSTGQWVHVDCCRTLSCARIFLMLKGSFAETHRERLGELKASCAERFLRRLNAKDWAGRSVKSNEMLICRRRRSAVPRQEGQMPSEAFHFVGCPPARQRCRRLRRLRGIRLRNEKRSSALPQTIGICSLRSNEKRRWNVVGRGTLSSK